MATTIMAIPIAITTTTIATTKKQLNNNENRTVKTKRIAMIITKRIKTLP